MYINSDFSRLEINLHGCLDNYRYFKSKLEASGLFMRASGSNTYYGSASKVQSQSLAAGEVTAMGTVVDVTFSTMDVDDGYIFSD